MMKIFFDASVLFSALYSATGASRQLVLLVKQEKVLGLVTQTIIEEVEAHRDKFPPGRVPNIFSWIAEQKFIVRTHMQMKEIEPWIDVVDFEDAHVVAGAELMKSDWLVTLDKKHLLKQEVQQMTNVTILTPKDALFKLRSHDS